MSGCKRFNSLLLTCISVLLLFCVLLSSLSTDVLAQKTTEEDPEYFMGILILESQQQRILDSIKKVKDLNLGNMVILHPLDQAWDLNLIEEAIREANNLGLYIIFEAYNFSAHDIRISPEQFATWRIQYPHLLGVIVQEVTGKQIDSKTWSDNSTGTINTRLQAEQSIIENITSSMQLPDFKNAGARIFLQENVVSYASANTSYCDVLVTKVFNAPNTELMIGLTRGMKNSYNIPEWGLWVDTWREWIKPPAFTPNDVERALYEGWFYGAKYFFFEQGNFYGTLDRDWPNKYIILGTDGKLTEYGKVIQRFYTFLQNQRNLGYSQPDYHSSIAVMIGQSGWSGRGSDWGFWEQSDRQADFDYTLLNLFFPGIGDNWQISEALTGKEFTGLPLGMVDIISVYAPSSVLKRYNVIVGLGWNHLSKEIVENIGEYVQDGGIFFSLLTFTHTNKDVDDLESAFAWTKSYDSLFGVHVATFVESGFNIKSDVQLHNITFTEDTFWYPWNGKIYNYVDSEKNGFWFWKFKYKLSPSENTKVIAWVNGFQDDTKAFIVENKKGEGYTYIVNTRNSHSLPGSVLSDVITDFVYFLCSYYVRAMTYLPYPEIEYWLCQGQADKAVYLMHDNSTNIETLNYSIRQSEVGLSANKDFLVYDYINNEYYGDTEIPVSYLNVTLQPNQAKLFLFLENNEIPQVLYSEALLTEAPLFVDTYLTVPLKGLEESTNITKIYCSDLGQPRYILGEKFNLTHDYNLSNKFLMLASNSNLTLSWDYIGDVSVVASTHSLTEISWNESREILSISADGTTEEQGEIQVQTGGAKPYYIKVDGKESSTWSYDASTGVMSASLSFTSDIAELVLGFKPIEIDRAFISDKRVDVDSVQVFAFHLSWMTNGSDVYAANVNVNGAEYETNQTGWISLDVSSNSVGRIDWRVLGVSIDGLTDYAKSVNDPFIIWDRVNITNCAVIDKLVQVGSSQAIWLTAEYEYDSVTFDGSKGIVMLDGERMVWSEQNGRWEQTVSSGILGPHIYDASSVDDEVYGLTSVHNLARKMVITWDKIKIAKMEFETSTLGVTNVKMHVAYDYTNLAVLDADVSVNGKHCTEIESGVYACKISDWSPIQSLLVRANIPEFEQATKTVLNIHVSNALLYTGIGLPILLAAAFLVLRKKRRKQKPGTSSSCMISSTRLLSFNFGKNEKDVMRG
jgi:LPXTG-motif cell wall-anchored protein